MGSNQSRTGTCCEAGCAKPIHAKRMCKAHYQAWYRVQNPEKFEAYNASRSPKQEKVCPCCEATFMGRVTAVYCTDRCGRIAAKRRAYERNRVDMECATCGITFRGAPYPPDVEHQHRYCSSECVAEAARVRFSKPCQHGCPSHSSCSECSTAYEPSPRTPVGPSSRLTQRPSVRRWIAGPCIECGESVIGQWHPKWPCRFCSRRCMNRVAKRRRRIRKQEGFREEVWRKKVLERDDWTCRICHKPIDRGAEVPHPLAATLDHIVPLALGGDHSYANIQAAHFRCNSLKGAQCEGQLHLAA